MSRRALLAFLLASFMGWTGSVRADEADEAVSSVGAGKAVLDVKEGVGFKLSETAMKTIEVTLQSVTGGGAVLLPADSIANLKGETGVYRLREGYFRLIPGKATPEGTRTRFVPAVAADLVKGDQVAVTGVPLLRVTELDVMGEGDEDAEEEEHSEEVFR